MKTILKRVFLCLPALVVTLPTAAQDIPPAPALPALPQAAVSSLPVSTFVWEDFELGFSYWATHFAGSVMSGGIIAPDFPSSGRYSYRGHFDLPANGGRAAFATDQAGDFTGATALTLDIYNSSKLPFDSSLVFKQGENWTWYQSGTQTIQPGWNKDVSFKIRQGPAGTAPTGPEIQLPVLTDLREAAILFDSKEKGEGYLYIDNLRLTGADPNKVARVRPEDQAVGTEVLAAGFEDGNSIFKPESFSGSSSTDVQVITARTSEGTHLAKMSFNNTNPDDKAFFTMEGDLDLTQTTGLRFDVYNPLADEVEVEACFSTGTDYQFFESPPQTLKPGWNRDVTFPLRSHTFKCAATNWRNSAALFPLSQIRKTSLTFLPHQIVNGYFGVDNVRFITQDPVALKKNLDDAFPPAPVVTGTDTLVEGFEQGSSNWGAASSFSAATGATIITASTTQGTHLLKADFDMGEGGKSAFFGFEGDMNLEGASAVKVDIYNPNKFPLQADLALSLGDNYQWFESKGFDLKPGWNKDVVFPLGGKGFKSQVSDWKYTLSAEPLAKLKKMYIGFYTHSPGKSEVYLDNIRVTGLNPASTKALVQFKPHEVKGRSVVWDPLTSSFGGWQADIKASDNSYATALTYERFQGQNAMRLQFQTSAPPQAAQYVKNETLDWTSVLGAKFDVYNPENYAMEMDMAFKTGPTQEWFETNRFKVQPGWNKGLFVDLTVPQLKAQRSNWANTEYLANKDNIQVAILQVYPNRAAGGEVVVSNLRTIERDPLGAMGAMGAGTIVGATSKSILEGQVETLTLMEGFENANAVGTASQSTLYATEGSHSLKFDYQALGSSTTSLVYTVPPAFQDLSAYNRIVFDIYNPNGPIQMDLAFQTSATSAWEESQPVTLNPGWNKDLSIQLLGNVFKSVQTAWKYWDTFRNQAHVDFINFKIFSPAGRGTIYLDNIRLGSNSLPLQKDGTLSEELSLKVNPSDAVQLVVGGRVTQPVNASSATAEFTKAQLDVRLPYNQLTLSTGTQLSSTDDPLALFQGASLGSQEFGIQERARVLSTSLQLEGFANYGETPNSLGNTSGYVARVHQDIVNGTILGLGLVTERNGNIPGSNPLTADVESDIKTYEADFQVLIPEAHLTLQGEAAQSAYTEYQGLSYGNPSSDNNAYFGQLAFWWGAFKLTGSWLQEGLGFFAPYSTGGNGGYTKWSGDLLWQMDTFGPLKSLMNTSKAANDFLENLTGEVQYFGYNVNPATSTYSNFDLRAILKNNNYKSPLFFQTWYHWFDEGQNVGDPTLANPALSTHALVQTFNQDLLYRITPQIYANYTFRYNYTDYWEQWTNAAGLKWRFWGDTWLTLDAKYLTQDGSWSGQFLNLYVDLTKHMLGDALTAHLTYGAPSFANYWNDDNNLQMVDKFSFGLAGKF